MKVKSTANLVSPIGEFASKRDWASWLDEHHGQSSGIWLRLAKLARKDSAHESVSYPEALDVALRYGWIDGQKRSESEDFWFQRFTPRSKKSIWSKINRTKALELMERGEMKPAGLEAVRAAQKDGRWEAAYDSPSRATIPDDLQSELDRDPKAKAFFTALDSRNRYAILHRLHTAKKIETRTKRLQLFMGMLRRKEKIHV